MGQGIEELGNDYLFTHWTSAGLRTVIHLHGNGDVLLYYQWNAVRYKDVIFFQKFYLNLVISTEFGKFTTAKSYLHHTSRSEVTSKNGTMNEKT